MRRQHESNDRARARGMGRTGPVGGLWEGGGVDNGAGGPLEPGGHTGQLPIYNDTAHHLGAYQADLLLVAYI